MFLKSLTLKGFKSFADKTTLDFEPGVCVVVGPNGSGKSNIVDAVAWVLGAQGARALRGGKMDDVIFAGTADRPALGRAEVSLTIDNTSRLLPIEFTEVTFTRTLFRTGESEYQINGAPCRLLDIQELLSDTGIGRRQHVIVGQGQLDTILNARPEDRRAIIEEAAGILKYRRRKEKAERRLEATEGNLLRLGDLLREVRRTLRPLERQADAARRHDGLVAELHAITLYLAGREIESLRTREERRRETRNGLASEEQDLRVRLRALDASVLDTEHALAIPGDDDVADLLTRTEALRERARGLVNLIAERRRGFERELTAVADEGVVETLVAEAADSRAQLLAVDADWATLAPNRAEVEAAEARVAQARADLDGGDDDGGGGGDDSGGGELSPQRARLAAESSYADAETARRDAERDAAQHRLRGDALAQERAQADAQLDAVAAQLAALAPERAAADLAEQEAAQLRAAVDADALVASELTPEGQAVRAAEATLQEADTALRAAETEASRWRARAETLALAIDEEHAAAGGEAINDVNGVIGPLVDHVEIEAGLEIAVAAALGDALKAIVVEGSRAARAAVERLKQGDAQAWLIVAAPDGGGGQTVLASPGTRPLVECVRGTRPGLDRVLARLLAPFVLVEGGWSAALDVALADPGVIAVTREGDRFGGSSPWRAGPPGSSAVTPAALTEAAARAEDADARRDVAAAAVEHARQMLAAARRAELVGTERERRRRTELDRVTAHAAQLRRDVDVRSASLEERHAQLVARREQLTPELASQPAADARAGARLADAEQICEAARAALDQAREQEAAALDQARAQRAELERLRSRAAQLRQDFEVRGAAVEERRAVLHRRLADVEARLAARPDEEAKARARRAQLEGRQRVAGEIAQRLATKGLEIDRLAERLRRRRQEQSAAAREAGRKLDSLRAERAEAEKQLGELRERIGRLEVDEAEIRLRLEQAVENVRREHDCEPEVAVAAPAPDTAEGVSLPAQARELERELRLMGPVNPLALSEWEALLERHEFLQKQLDDVKNTRRELARVIRAVDDEIVTVFTTAFADVAEHFAELFMMLFPGGSGRLVLTQPDDMLNSGIEMEARPSGKMLRRLSLLSGGERSLTALAYLFAVFRARPSPFYLMDEVEAALDDVNLHRFIDLVHEFRGEAQLLVVSHQKRTMEAADVLYGVSMPPGGSSTVVSQRIRDLQLEDV